MKLFQVRDTAEGRTLEPTYPSKQAAQKVRDELNGPRDPEHPDRQPRFVVTPGPDHRRYDGGH